MFLRADAWHYRRAKREPTRGRQGAASPPIIVQHGSFHLSDARGTFYSGYNAPMKKLLPLLLGMMVLIAVPAFATQHHHHGHHHSHHHHAHRAS
jgi:hypothetical protein